MRAIFKGQGSGEWKGIQVARDQVAEIPEHLESMVRANANFEVIEADQVVGADQVEPLSETQADAEPETPAEPGEETEAEPAPAGKPRRAKG